MQVADDEGVVFCHIIHNHLLSGRKGRDLVTGLARLCSPATPPQVAFATFRLSNPITGRKGRDLNPREAFAPAAFRER